jgi:hypothetical protein
MLSLQPAKVAQLIKMVAQTKARKPFVIPYLAIGSLHLPMRGFLCRFLFRELHRSINFNFSENFIKAQIESLKF